MRIMMRLSLVTLGAMLLGLAGVAADEAPAVIPAHARFGIPCASDCATTWCKPVQENKKKTVYRCKTEEFCLPVPGSLFPKSCDECLAAVPRTRRVLVKREIPEPCPTIKWVPEKSVMPGR